MYKILITLVGSAKDHGGGTHHTSMQVVEFTGYAEAVSALSSINSAREPNGAVSLRAYPLFKV